MAWGQAGARGIDDLVHRIANNDAKLTSLTILRQRRFSHDDMASLVRAMASNTNLTELYASSHALAPHTASLVADMLLASTSLRSLCVGDSSLGDDGVAALARGVAGSKSLTCLDLCNKGLGRRGAEALAGTLTAASSLSHLILSSNAALGDDGLTALCSGAAAAAAAANFANAADGGDGPAAAPAGTGLRVLEVQGCGVGAAGVRALASASASAAASSLPFPVRSCVGRLEVLRLDGNSLGPEGGRALAELLRAASGLRELHLRGTELGEQGSEELAAGLAPAEGAGCCGLTHLDLADCELGPRAMAALRDAFSAGARLQVLCLAGNPRVTDADVAALGAVLGDLPQREREQGQEEAPVAAGQAEAEAAEQAAARARLQHLDVSGTAAGPLAVAALSEAPGLRHLSLVGCPLGTVGAAALATSLNPGEPEQEAASAAEGAETAAAASPRRRWSALRELCVSGAGMSGADLAAVFGALTAGGAPQLQSLEVGANPGVQEEVFQGELLPALRAARPGLAVYWRSGDDPAPAVAGR